MIIHMTRNQHQRDFARQLRNALQEAERRLWQFLRAEKLGVKFRRQAPIGAYVADFVCFARKLIIELDGPQHADSRAQDHDRQRTAWLASQGFRVIRFRNQALDDDIWKVVENIKQALEQPPPQADQDSPSWSEPN